MKKIKKITAFLLALSLASVSAFASSGANVSAYYDYYPGIYGIRGDADGNGKLTAADIQKFHEHLLCDEDPDNGSIEKYIYDVNSDGQIDVFDMIRLKAAVIEKQKIWSYKNLPEMDGSTSAIPLEAGFKSRLLGLPYYTARNLVFHHKTHESFQMLLSGDIDMIFTVPISESQQKAADEAGVHLNMVPVAKEGFVFVVNKDNPVDSLTQQQIKDIYSGKITNWSEVGGNDEPIIPYQRNRDSGSQNYMTDFMKDSELSDPPAIYRITSMGALMDAVAVYENSTQAIGYSVYSYAAQMYENSSSVKFIAVDGIRPTRETMADDSYPLLSSTYIMYTDDASQDTLDFTKWAVSESGQQCVLENGYIPVNTMEYPYWLRPYNSAGTGREKPEDYVPDRKYSYFSDSCCGSEANKYRLSCLKDKKIQKEINGWITETLDKTPNPDLVSVHAVNGYMSILIMSKKNEYDYPDDFGSVSSYKDVATFNYDLRAGRKIENISDYFYKDVNFIEGINKCVGEKMNKELMFLGKTDFLGLAGNIENFTDRDIYSGDNSYFAADNLEFSYNTYYTPDIMVTGEYYDMSDLFTDPETVNDRFYDEWNYTYLSFGGENYIRTLEGSRFHSEEEISEKKKVYGNICSFIKNMLEKEGIKFETYLIKEPEKRGNLNQLNVMLAYRENLLEDYIEEKYMFDPDTGEHIDYSDIFGEAAGKYDGMNMDVSMYIEDGILYVNFFGRFMYEDDVEFIPFNKDEVNLKYINWK